MQIVPPFEWLLIWDFTILFQMKNGTLDFNLYIFNTIPIHMKIQQNTMNNFLNFIGFLISPYKTPVISFHVNDYEFFITILDKTNFLNKFNIKILQNNSELSIEDFLEEIVSTDQPEKFFQKVISAQSYEIEKYDIIHPFDSPNLTPYGEFRDNLKTKLDALIKKLVKVELIIPVLVI